MFAGYFMAQIKIKAQNWRKVLFLFFPVHVVDGGRSANSAIDFNLIMIMLSMIIMIILRCYNLISILIM